MLKNPLEGKHFILKKTHFPPFILTVISSSECSSFAVMKHYERKELGTKRVCLAYAATFIAEGSQAQELGCRGHGGLVPTGFFLMAYSFCLIVESSVTIPLVASPTMCCALSRGSLIGKMLYMLAYILILWSKFLSEVASSQTTLVSGDSS